MSRERSAEEAVFGLRRQSVAATALSISTGLPQGLGINLTASTPLLSLRSSVKTASSLRSAAVVQKNHFSAASDHFKPGLDLLLLLLLFL